MELVFLSLEAIFSLATSLIVSKAFLLLLIAFLFFIS